MFTINFSIKEKTLQNKEIENIIVNNLQFVLTNKFNALIRT
jgi:hypothetical protein